MYNTNALQQSPHIVPPHEARVPQLPIKRQSSHPPPALKTQHNMSAATKTSSAPAENPFPLLSSYSPSPLGTSAQTKRPRPVSTSSVSAGAAKAPRRTAPATRLRPPRFAQRRLPPVITTAAAKAASMLSAAHFVSSQSSDVTSVSSTPPQSQSQQYQEPPVTLSAGQQDVVTAVLCGKSVFFTGCAGTGKSFLLNHLIKILTASTTAITASTGIAALALKGTTLHSFAGIGMGGDSAVELAAEVNKMAKFRRRWQQTRTLIIDEISMISGDLFDKLDYIAKNVRRDSRPFGGIQLVLTGDFLQLPPVSHGNAPFKYAFEAKGWNDAINVTIELDRVFRQTDTSLIDILTRVRNGKVDSGVIEAFNACTGRSFNIYDDGIEPTMLYSTKRQVEEENQIKLSQLPTTDLYTYNAYDQAQNVMYRDQLNKWSNAMTELTLKVGCQVMLIKNTAADKGLVNGSRGVIIGFEYDSNSADEDPRVWKNIRSDQFWPYVRFTNGYETIIRPDQWQIEVARVPVATRHQVPLILAWSLTIHKCQGMTLDRVTLDLGTVFEFGQAYVALSRIRCFSSLKLLNKFNPAVIKAHPRALAFYTQLHQQKQQRLQALADAEKNRPLPSIQLIQANITSSSTSSSTSTSLTQRPSPVPSVNTRLNDYDAEEEAYRLQMDDMDIGTGMSTNITTTTTAMVMTTGSADNEWQRTGRRTQTLSQTDSMQFRSHHQTTTNNATKPATIPTAFVSARSLVARPTVAEKKQQQYHESTSQQHEQQIYTEGSSYQPTPPSFQSASSRPSVPECISLLDSDDEDDVAVGAVAVSEFTNDFYHVQQTRQFMSKEQDDNNQQQIKNEMIVDSTAITTLSMSQPPPLDTVMTTTTSTNTTTTITQTTAAPALSTSLQNSQDNNSIHNATSNATAHALPLSSLPPYHPAAPLIECRCHIHQLPCTYVERLIADDDDSDEDDVRNGADENAIPATTQSAVTKSHQPLSQRLLRVYRCKLDCQFEMAIKYTALNKTTTNDSFLQQHHHDNASTK